MKLKKKLNIFKKITSVLVSLLMILSVVYISPKKVDAETPKGYITVSMEKFTLGLGYLIEPVQVPFYEKDTGTTIITRLMEKNGYKYKYTGSIDDTSGIVGNAFYLSYVEDKDYREAKIPQYILNKIEQDGGDIEGRDKEGWLGEFDYTFMSGWMYSVNNIFPGYGATSYKPKDGDVMRWQFTVWGYGGDIGDNSAWGQAAYLAYANRDKLTTEVAKINSSADRQKLLSNSEIKKAYDDAMVLLEDMTSSQASVDNAYNNLIAAVKEANIKLEAPTLQLAATTPTSAKINWNKVDNATGYEIYRATGNSDNYELIKDINNATTLSYEDNDLSSKTSYKYKVKAYRATTGAKRYSNESNIVTATTKEETVNVTFDADNETENTVKSVSKDKALDYTPKVPTKEGYIFVGWYKNTDDITTAYKNNSKYAENVTYKAKWAHVNMIGAEAKLLENDKSGIRFATKLYNDGDEVVEKGTLIIPANLLKNGETLSLNTAKVAKSVAKVAYEENKEQNYVTYLGTIVNMPKSQFGREMTAASYVIYKDKQGNQYEVYSPYASGTITINDLLGIK